jgi:hypothetical protein
MTIMANWFKIPPAGYDGFRDLIDLGPDRLVRLSKSPTLDELTLDVKAVAETLSKTLVFESDRIERAITAVLLPLSGMRAAFEMEPSSFLQLLSDLIKKQNLEWYNENSDDWQKIAPFLEPLIAADGFYAILYKVFQLLVHRPALVRDLKILTELRPVYDDEVTSVKAMLMTSTLVINYEENTVSKRLHLSLDEEDLDTLRDQLDRAGRKGQRLEEKVSELKIPILIAGA